MKLRNKKTGKIVNVNKIGLAYNQVNAPFDLGVYNSLAELNADWEDYTPKEPLIKDEKIRKVIRAWAEINDIERVEYSKFFHPTSYRLECDSSDDTIAIDFVGLVSELKDCKVYTIAELCGEEEK